MVSSAGQFEVIEAQQRVPAVLRRLQAESGLTHEHFADELQWSLPKIIQLDAERSPIVPGLLQTAEYGWGHSMGLNGPINACHSSTCRGLFGSLFLGIVGIVAIFFTLCQRRQSSAANRPTIEIAAVRSSPHLPWSGRQRQALGPSGGGSPGGPLFGFMRI